MTDNGQAFDYPDMGIFQENRCRFPPDQLLPYSGQHVAWSLDGTSILASGQDMEEVENKLVAAGIDPLMTMTFRYYQDKIIQPAVALGGSIIRPRPVIAVTLLGPTNARLLEAHLDTGSDDTVFPERIAQQLGIDLTHAQQGQARGVGMAGAPLRYVRLPLRIAAGSERREWTAWVAFTPVPMKRPLLGFAGCLQFFTATFHGDREIVELTINSLYPGT
jgi:hypothetical protein